MSSLIRELVIDFQKKSDPNSVYLEKHPVTIERIELDDRTLHLLLDESLAKALKLKTRKVKIQL